MKYVTLLLAGGLLKLLYGRSHVYETDLGSSKWWNPIWERRPNDLWDELGRMFTKFSYPSVHTLAVMGAVLFGVNNPAAWILLAVVAVWLVLANHHWLSDVLSAFALTGAAIDLLK